MIYIYIGIGLVIVCLAIFGNKETHTYNAEFGNAGQFLSRFNHGFMVTGNKAITKKQSYTNCALFGPTGSGKTSTVILGTVISLARGLSSIIINDVSREVFEKLSGFLASLNYLILWVDFSNSSYHSESFNPLSTCNSIPDINKTALLTYRNASGETTGDKFWEQSSISLISLFMRYLIFHTEPEFHTMQNVLRLIEKFAVDGPAVDRLMARTGDEELLSAYKATVVVGDKTLQSIIASARSVLSLWCDTEICRTTATNTIDFNLLRKGDQPVAIFVCNPLKDLQYYKPISALFFQSLFNYVLSEIPGKNDRSVFFIMEEFATMKFPNLSTTVSNIRKYKSGMLLCMQDEMALTAQYGQAEAHQIKTNCGCQVYLKGQPLHTCKELSQILGKYSYTDDKEIERSRELLTPDEIRMSDDAIILINNQAPLKCKPIPVYKNLWLRRHLTLPPYPLDTKAVSDPPLIPFV